MPPPSGTKSINNRCPTISTKIRRREGVSGWGISRPNRNLDQIPRLMFSHQKVTIGLECMGMARTNKSWHLTYTTKPNVTRQPSTQLSGNQGDLLMMCATFTNRGGGSYQSMILQATDRSLWWRDSIVSILDIGWMLGTKGWPARQLCQSAEIYKTSSSVSNSMQHNNHTGLTKSVMYLHARGWNLAPCDVHSRWNQTECSVTLVRDSSLLSQHLTQVTDLDLSLLTFSWANLGLVHSSSNSVITSNKQCHKPEQNRLLTIMFQNTDNVHRQTGLHADQWLKCIWLPETW